MVLFLFILCRINFSISFVQESSFKIPGNKHYDVLEDHDMNWFKIKPDDFRQDTKEFTIYTKTNRNDFAEILKPKAQSVTTPLIAVIHSNDLPEVPTCRDTQLLKPIAKKEPKNEILCRFRKRTL